MSPRSKRKKAGRITLEIARKKLRVEKDDSGSCGVHSPDIASSASASGERIGDHVEATQAATSTQSDSDRAASFSETPGSSSELTPVVPPDSEPEGASGPSAMVYAAPDGCAVDEVVQGDAAMGNGLEHESSSDSGSDTAVRVDNQPLSHEECARLAIDIEAAFDALRDSKDRGRPPVDELTRTRVGLMLSSLRLRCAMDTGLTRASCLAAASMGFGTWAARRARRWIREFKISGRLPENLYGRWNSSVMEDEDFVLSIKEHLRSQGRYAGAQHVAGFFHTDEARTFRYLLDSPPSLRTAQRWMKLMGFDWGKERRGMFSDGHERADVVDYRQNTYIPAWLNAERFMRLWDDQDREIAPQLRPGERRVIWWFHDESTFYAHDRRLTRWVHKDEPAGIRKKGEGVSIMVADLISADYGWLQRHLADGTRRQDLPEEDRDARVFFKAGNSRDGWFGIRHLCDQLRRAIRVAKEQYPDEDHVFVYDNATTHTVLPEAAPDVHRMTLRPSLHVQAEVTGLDGKKSKVNMKPARFDNGSPQELYYPPNHPNPNLQGKFKGLTTLLQERGILGTEHLRLKCTGNGEVKGCTPGQTDCCARRTMLCQPDFMGQKPALREIAEANGCSVVYLPKYHCELNPIEQCWGAAKRVYREFPMSSSAADLKRNMLAALDSVSLESIRRFAMRSRRFVHAYWRGLTGAQAIWANKQYRGHRVINENIMQMI